MKKVLHISKYYPPVFGGIEQTAYDVVEALKDNHEQRVICFNTEKKTFIDEYSGIKVIRVGTLKKIFSQDLSFSYGYELKRAIKEFNPEFIHIHLPNPFSMIHLLKLKNELKDIKIIVHWHSDIIKQKMIGFLLKHYQHEQLKIAYKIIATSPKYIEGSEYLKKHRDKIMVIPSVVNNSKFVLTGENIINIENIKKKYGNKIIIFVGRHTRYKGLNYLIEAAKYINKDTNILILGEGEETEKLKKNAKNIKNIFFIGRVLNSELKEFIHAATVFAFPSTTKNEAFGLALAEALYCGIPAVCFEIQGSGVSWVNKNNETGFVVENKNVRQFAEGLNKIIENNELRIGMSENAKSWIESICSNERFNLEINKIYV